MDLTQKYNNFIENLRTEDNSELIDTINEGFQLISESLSTDDANVKKYGQAIPLSGIPATTTNIHHNSDNEYFNQTLNEKILNIVKNAQAGKRIWEHAKSGRWIISHDPLKFGNNDQQNANFTGDSGWAGSSGGYNLGGPIQGSNLAY